MGTPRTRQPLFLSPRARAVQSRESVPPSWARRDGTPAHAAHTALARRAVAHPATAAARARSRCSLLLDAYCRRHLYGGEAPASRAPPPSLPPRRLHTGIVGRTRRGRPAAGGDGWQPAARAPALRAKLVRARARCGGRCAGDRRRGPSLLAPSPPRGGLSCLLTGWRSHRRRRHPPPPCRRQTCPRSRGCYRCSRGRRGRARSSRG